MSKKAKNLPAPMRPWASPEGHGAHYLNVEWAMPPATTPPAEFEVQYGFRLLGKWFTHARGLTDDPACEQRRVEPLKPSEKYTIRVRARFAGQGWGPWSPKSETMVTLADGAGAQRPHASDGLLTCPDTSLQRHMTHTCRHRSQRLSM